MPTVQSRKTQEFWAFCTFYEPFRMGGSVWVKKKFKVQASPVWLRGHRGFVFFDEKHSQTWKVYEATTGGFVAEHKTRNGAVRKARYAIASTPDFAEQVQAVGSPEGYEEATADEALRRLHKSDDLQKVAGKRDT